MFNPPLPLQHRNVIENIGFGTINKIFLRFDQKWWTEEFKGLQLLWKDSLNENSHWTKYISGFDLVYPSPENTLLGWIGGQGAIEMEKLSDKEVMNECMNLIRKFLKRNDIKDPTHFYCSRWHSNEHIKGAYSFTCNKTDDINDWEKILSRPIIFESPFNHDRNVILFAGEACHEQYFSTIHGAFLSGVDQAKNILNIRTQQKTKSKL
jgi:monoamine oxidase